MTTAKRGEVWREGLASVGARAHGYYTEPELYRHKNVMKRLRTGRGRQMARKIKENGNNGERTAGQANIFVSLRARFALPYRAPTNCRLFRSTTAFHANFHTRSQLF